ncbi:hypothetical protein MACK_003102 [Theileria orientalis]|uniref:Uncharacterized protein n=1 Tax=Theileria orientalis TaxID=68886 RepID=A0A976ME57_THEOR|nr:hypothetical protein MACK_003102 [Theileria orientalis]
MSEKFYTVNICNKTSFVLFRHSHRIRHGNWVTWLPEKIKPSSSVSVSFKNSRSGHSCRSTLQYGVILDGIYHILEFRLEKSSDSDDYYCSFKPVQKRDHIVNNDSFKLLNNVPENLCKINIQIIDPNKASFIESSETIYIVNIEETPEGYSYVNSLRNKFNSKVSMLQEQYEKWSPRYFVGMELMNLYKRAPNDFCWDYNRLDLLNNLRKSNVSVLVRIVNLTSKELRLGLSPSKIHNSCVLEEGVWVGFPNEEIGRMCGTEFGTKTAGFLGGTAGRCVYTILGESGSLTFTWDRPSIGPFSAKCKHSLNKYSVIVHTESSNHSTAIFHIIDNFSMPIQILTARAVSPRLTSKYNGPRLLQRYLDPSTAIQPNASDTSVEELLITPFLTKLQNLHGSNSGLNDLSNVNLPNTDLFIKSPKHFFSSVNSTNINSPINKVPPDSSIYIEWMIGNEIFCKLFKFDEKIHLSSSVISGVSDNKAVVLNSVLLRVDFSSMFKTADSDNKLSNLSNGDTDGLTRPYLRTFKQEELLDYVVVIFHSVCDAFQPYINKCMTKKFGVNWLKICKLPSGHIWKNQETARIDLEGIVYIVTAYWMEVFEQVLRETTHLNIIQTAAIYWANQELQRFDSNYVWDVLQSAKVLLQKLKADSYLKNIEFISNKLVQSQSI